MKLTAILLTVVLLEVSAEGLSQTVTFSGKDVPLETVFTAIKNQTDYIFFYTVDIWKNAKPVTVNVKNATVQELIKLVLKDQPISFVIEDRTIILSKKAVPLPEKRASLINIRGKVVSENGFALEGVNVIVKGTTNGTSTNANGEFMLRGVDENAILVVSSIGYDKLEISIRGKEFINLQLKTTTADLDEIQVIGYGTISKRYNTGNVVSVKATDIEKQPVSNPLLALQGRVTGAQIVQSTGLPGTSVRVQIRGQNSIANGNEPLYVIDGVQYASLNLFSPVQFVLGNSSSSANSGYSAGSPFSYLNPADIESIDILKDADATAIYGSRGANGVILITTKKGKQGKMRVNVNAQTGFGKVSRKLKVLNTRQYLDMRYEAFKNDGAAPNINADYDLTLWDTTRYTDWQKVLIGGTAKYNDIETAISGGSENIQYRLGGGYHKETTVFPGDFADRKASAQFNVTGSSSNKKFQINFSGLYTNDINQLCSNDFTDQAIKLAPNAPALYNADGSINWAPNANGVSTWNFAQPIAMTLVRFRSKTNNLISNSVLSYKILPDLEVKSSFGYNTVQTNDIQRQPQSSFEPSAIAVRQRASTFVNNRVESWIIEPQINYGRKIANGDLSMLVGTTFQQRKTESQQIIAQGFNSDLVLENVGAANNVTAFPGVNTEYKYNAFFGRINYNYEGKYIVNLTGRRDGSSRFGPANQFHNFGAIGAAWIFSRERFIEKLLPFLSYGKLRGSYGTTGNDEIGDYSFMDVYVTDPVGVPYQGTQGIRPSRIFTPDLAWEETEKMELGLDLGFINDRLYLGASFYQNRSSNQLIAYSLPSTSGFTSLSKNLNALVQNSGVELEIKSVNIRTKKIQWTTSLNISGNRNKLLSASEGVSQSIKDKVGLPINSIFVYKYLGVDFVSGLYQVADENGSVTSTPKLTDAKIAVNYMVPKLSGGLQNSLSWDGFQMDFLIQFVYDMTAKDYYYNYMPGFFGPFYGSNQPSTVLNHWQKPGDITSIQKFSQNFSTVRAYENANNSDQLYREVSYARLKNAAISWALPKSWKQKLHLQAAKVFVQGQNLFTVTNYKGLDPETCFGESIHLPPLRVITFGVQFTL